MLSHLQFPGVLYWYAKGTTTVNGAAWSVNHNTSWVKAADASFHKGQDFDKTDTSTRKGKRCRSCYPNSFQIFRVQRRAIKERGVGWIAFEHSFQLKTGKRPIRYKQRQERKKKIHQSLIIICSALLHFSEKPFAVTTYCLKESYRDFGSSAKAHSLDFNENKLL